MDTRAAVRGAGAGLPADFVNDITQIYLNEIGQHPLLKADEELRSRVQ